MGRKCIVMILILTFLNFLISPDVALALRDDYDKYDFSSLGDDKDSNTWEYIGYGAVALGVVICIVMLVKSKSSSAENQAKETNQYAGIHNDEKIQFADQYGGKIEILSW